MAELRVILSSTTVRLSCRPLYSQPSVVPVLLLCSLVVLGASSGPFPDDECIAWEIFLPFTIAGAEQGSKQAFCKY